MIQKLKMQTPNLVDKNVEQIAGLFPEVITEIKDKEGNIIKGIDFDLLKQKLSHVLVEDENERYRLDWPGKKASLLKANTPITKTLRPVVAESVNFDKTENLYIEGDNFEVLKILQESYLGKVKMIYIDPPYNTGNDFIYKDDFRKSTDEYEEEINATDEEGGRLFRNTDSNGRFHSDWLSMMYERLVIVRDLLTDDGVIFISIDDNELHNLRKVCDEIFDDDNAIATFVWEQGRKSASTSVAINHEYCVIYAKNKQLILKLNNDTEIYWKEKKAGLDAIYSKVKELHKEYGNNYSKMSEEIKQYYNSLKPDDPILKNKHYNQIDARGLYFPADAAAPDNPEKRSHKQLVHPNGKPTAVPKMGWRFTEQTLQKLIDDDRIHFGENETTVPCKKTYLKETEYEVVPSVFYKDGRGASKRLDNIMGGRCFEFPKDETIIMNFIKYCIPKPDRNEIVLDFFAGSGTTAHAVMQLNAEDGNNRKFILVQLPERTEDKSVAYKAGYKTIADIGKERIRRAGKKIQEEFLSKYTRELEKINNELLQGSLIENEELKEQKSELESKIEHIKNLDIGFRVYKTDSSNMKDVFYHPTDIKQEQLSTFVSNIKEDRTPEDLLTQVMLDLGLELSLSIEKREILGNNVFVVQENALVACFDDNINFGIVDVIADLKPFKVVFKDAGFADDKDRINVEERFKRLSPETVITVI